MANKFGKFLLFSALAGAAAYGAYSYLQKKEQPLASVPEEDSDDDFDDFSEDLDEDLTPEKNRSYVSLNLDKAEAFANEAFHKAKEVISDSVQQVKETVKSVADSQGYHTSFTDLTHPDKEESPKAPSQKDEETDAPADDKAVSPDFEKMPEESGEVEEFFNDDKE